MTSNAPSPDPHIVASGPPPTGSVRRLTPAVALVVFVLLASQFVALLWVSSYAKKGPSFGGFPFFYWYSLLWLIIGAVEMQICYVLVHRDERRAQR